MVNLLLSSPKAECASCGTATEATFFVYTDRTNLPSMTDLIALVAHHGYLIVFLVVMAESLALPLPAALALVGGGAAAASGTLKLSWVYAVAVAAMLIGD